MKGHRLKPDSEEGPASPLVRTHASAQHRASRVKAHWMKGICLRQFESGIYAVVGSAGLFVA